MQDCKGIQERLSAYMDHELEPAVHEQVERHLETCGACRAELRWLERLWEALAHVPEPAPVDITTAVLARLPRRERRWPQSLALAAAVLLGVFLGSRMGLDLQATLTAREPAVHMAALEEVFDDHPQGSLGTVLVTYDMGNGNGS